jgi:hypothetical protein
MSEKVGTRPLSPSFPRAYSCLLQEIRIRTDVRELTLLREMRGAAPPAAVSTS